MYYPLRADCLSGNVLQFFKNEPFSPSIYRFHARLQRIWENGLDMLFANFSSACNVIFKRIWVFLKLTQNFHVNEKSFDFSNFRKMLQVFFIHIEIKFTVLDLTN